LQQQNVKRFRIQCLVLCPTRELADQVATEIRKLGRGIHNIKVLTLCGGMSFGPQVGSLEHGAHIVVGTPGRVEEHLRKGTLKLDDLNCFVFDEADRMLDMGFINDIKKILNLMPKRRQNLLFSATFSHEIRQLAKGLVHDPVEISVSPANTTVESVTHSIIPVDKRRKAELLIHLLNENRWQQVLVFCRTKHGANKLTKQLEKERLPASAIHGNKSQGARTKALSQFKNNKIQVLVSTDIAARGIDISELPYVVNFDLPNDAEDYVHRIGRTGRAGASGVAINFACEDYAMSLPDIEQYIGHKIEVSKITNELLVTPKAPARIERKKKLHDRKSVQKANPQHKTGTPHHHKKKKATTPHGKKQHENKQHAKPHSHRNQDIKAKPSSDNGMTKKSAGLSTQIQPVKPGLIKTFLNKLISGF